MHAPEEALGHAILALTRFINDPRHDWRMMAEAGLDLDPAFLPALVGLSVKGPCGVVELSGLIARDHSTTSRQIGRLESAGLVARRVSETDSRVRLAELTPAGEAAAARLASARRRLLAAVLAHWPTEDRRALADLLSRFVEDLTVATAP